MPRPARLGCALSLSPFHAPLAMSFWRSTGTPVSVHSCVLNVTADSALSTSTSSNFWFDHLIVHLTIGASYSSSTSRETTRCGGFSAAL